MLVAVAVEVLVAVLVAVTLTVLVGVWTAQPVPKAFMAAVGSPLFPKAPMAYPCQLL